MGEKAKSGKYWQFCQALKKANVEARALHIQRINRAGQGGAKVEEESVTVKTELNPKTGRQVEVARETRTTTKKALPVWQASAWILERRFPNEFGRHIQPQAPDTKDPMDEWLEALSDAEKEYA
jgi:ribosomal protein L15E